MSIADKLTTIADNEQKVYDKGVSDGELEFWDAVTNGGDRDSYAYAFARWGSEYIHPPFKIAPKGDCNHIFLGCERLKKIERNYFDFSNATTINTFCNGAVSLEEIEDVNLSEGSYYQSFAYCYKLHTIARLVCSENTQNFTDAFRHCNKLQNIIIDGTVAKSINFQWCPLSVDSLKSIITALKDYSGTSNANTYTLTVKASAFNALDEDWKAIPINKAWNLTLAE